MASVGTIGFLGAGKMAMALAKGWLSAGVVTRDDIRASDHLPEARAAFQGVTEALVGDDNRTVVEVADVLVLAVKPQGMAGLLDEVRHAVTERQVVVSIAAGVTLDQLAAGLPEGARLVRVMPNTPCLVGASATGYTPGPSATAEDAALVERLFNAVGRAYRVPEHLLDAVTGLSGSGPAFVFVMIEALADGGVRAGLPRETALALAAQTVLGSAKMVLETGQHPASLKDAVASPAGTTIAGLHALEQGGVRAALMNAVAAAAARAAELGRGQ